MGCVERKGSDRGECGGSRRRIGRLETAVFLATKGTISPDQVYFLMLHQAESPDVLRELMLKV